MRVQYKGNFAHTPQLGTLEVLFNYSIVVEDGVITSIEPLTPHLNIDVDDIVETTNRSFFFPGFIDTHTHAPQYPNAGILGKSTLLNWLEKYTFPLENKFQSLEVADKVYSKVVSRQLANGTTSCAYFGTVHLDSTLRLAEICHSQGIRGYVGRVCMHMHCPEYLSDHGNTQIDAEFIRKVRNLNSQLVKPVITPRFAPSCSLETLAKLGELAQQTNVHVQTHVSENKHEIEWVSNLFQNNSYTGIYEKAGLLGPNTILAHAIHLTDEEIAIVQLSGSGISHCPWSNSSLSSGIAPIKKYLSLGLKVGLGTDMSAGPTLSMLKNTQQAILVSRLLTPDAGLSIDEALYIATKGGSDVLNEPRIGTFKVGNYFDAQLVDLVAKDSPVDIFECVLPENEELIEYLVHKWVYVGDDRNTVKVWVNGELVHSRD